MKKRIVIFIILIIAAILIFSSKRLQFLISQPAVGSPIDSLHGVLVYYNGAISHVQERHLSADGYNIGLKYQCVEFVKRYYLQVYNHKMPDSYGHAVSFFNKELVDSAYNSARDLFQYKNPSCSIPHVGDLLVYSGSDANPYGHVSIIASVGSDKIEVIQQNAGTFGHSREEFKLLKTNNLYRIDNPRILGWLRK